MSIAELSLRRPVTTVSGMRMKTSLRPGTQVFSSRSSLSTAVASPGRAWDGAAAKAASAKRRSRRAGRETVRRGDLRPALLFLAPWVVGFLVFTAWPVGYTFYLSLTDYDVFNAPNFVGMENYARLVAVELGEVAGPGCVVGAAAAAEQLYAPGRRLYKERDCASQARAAGCRR